MQDFPSPPPFRTLEPAPGAKASTQLGIWSLVSNLLCACFPVAIGLGIGALVKHGKAKRIAAEEPHRYEQPSSLGMVLGIIGICWTVISLGIVSAIAIPALVGQRERARERVVQQYVAMVKVEAMQVAEDLPRPPGTPLDPGAVVKAVLLRPALQASACPNPYSPQDPSLVAGDRPARDGQIALRGGFGVVDGLPGRPVLEIRAQVRRGGRPELLTATVPLD